MAVRYFRTIDELGRIVLPAELLHHLNWENVCFHWRKRWLFNRFFCPGCRQKLLPPSPVNPQDSPDGPSKIISLPVSKKWQNRFPNKNKEAFFCLFCSFGGWTATVGRFWKASLKKPRNPHKHWKNRGDNNFVTPSWEGVTKLLSSGLIPFGINLLNKNQKGLPTKWEFRVRNRYIW